MRGTLPLDADYMLEHAPTEPFSWVREGTSLWLFEENGAFAIPRIGVEAEPWTWTNRRFQSNLAFPDGRILLNSGLGEMPPILDSAGRPTILGGGPLTFRCIEPFARWHVGYDGTAIDTHVSQQIALSVDRERLVPLRYAFELEMVVPPNEQNITPEVFFRLNKGRQRDAASIGLGWRFEQMLRGTGWIELDGKRRSANVVGSRVKRRSVRTDGLFLRGHCWQAVVFPDGRAAGFEARPPHDDGEEPWNAGFVYQDGRMYSAKATHIPWLRQVVERGEDVSFELESEVGLTRIGGVTAFTTFQLSKDHLRGLVLSQSGARYNWDGVESYGMIERSSKEVAPAA